jgi:high affinity Mn2+ porin
MVARKTHREKRKRTFVVHIPVVASDWRNSQKSGYGRVSEERTAAQVGNRWISHSAPGADPTLDINDVIVSIRRNRSKYGFYANVEQAITKDVGIFARASWNDGRNEILSFTDVDQSLSGGVSAKGSSWGRPDDTVGLGGAINGLSSAHRDFLAAGGNGLLIGDGRLNYRPEGILEAYYAYKLNTWSTLTFDYQFIANPAHNADRGPVSVFSARAHAEF